MRPRLLAPFLLIACAADQGVSAFVSPAATWRVRELNTAPFTGRATLTFPAPGRISGQGPCNTFTATQNAPYP